MSNFLYHRPSDRVTAGSWSVSTGTPRSGYPVTNLDDLDPSNPFWITGTSVRVVRDFGSAQRIDHVYIFAHTFVNAADLRLQMHTSNSWGTPDVNISVTVPTAYLDGFAYHLHVDVAAAVPVAANRTKQFLSIANLSANTVTVAMGEVCLFANDRSLTRNVRLGFTQPRHRLTSRSTSKRGVSTVYDMGSIERGFAAEVPASGQDFEDLRTLEADARGDAQPWVFVLSPNDSTSRLAEPLLVRFASTVTEGPFTLSNYIPTAFQVEELGRGELLGA